MDANDLVVERVVGRCGVGRRVIEALIYACSMVGDGRCAPGSAWQPRCPRFIAAPAMIRATGVRLAVDVELGRPLFD